MKYIKSTFKTNHFSSEEGFRCSCCGELKLSVQLLDILEILRNNLGAPIWINSGYRCKTHNTKVGGAKNSFHVKGLAVDLRTVPEYMGKLQSLIETDSRFTGIGYYRNWLHVDCRPGSRVTWGTRIDYEVKEFLEEE